MPKNNKSVKSLIQEAERNACAIRSASGYGQSDIVDVYDVSTRLGYRVLLSEDLLQGVNGELAARIRSMDAKEWSAFALPALKLIIYNHDQTLERRSVSIMEEIAHLFLGHAPSTFVATPDASTNRTFDSENEQVAYWTGAAVLLPASVLSRSIWRGIALGDIASERSVSIELVEFRAKTLGLREEVVRDRAA